ncbi:MAG: hypothetical protein KY476_10670 [Planctomycetes bacterium]|nr:hypothetical protein [Planctomycetota bacterium]
MNALLYNEADGTLITIRNNRVTAIDKPIRPVNNLPHTEEPLVAPMLNTTQTAAVADDGPLLPPSTLPC